MASQQSSSRVQKQRPAGRPRNYELLPGVMRFSRSTMAHKKGLWAVKSRKVVARKGRRQTDQARLAKRDASGQEVEGTKTRRLKGDLDALRKTKRNTKSPFKAARHSKPLRKSITPGTVVILVAGRHRGKRVLVLKQLKSGLLLVSGPWNYNRCPLRRVNQRYVIATKTKVDISGVNIADNINDDYFRREKKQKNKAQKTEASPFAKPDDKKYQLSRQRVDDQINVDKQLMQAINKHPEKEDLKAYLCTLFQLSTKTFPHKLVF